MNKNEHLTNIFYDKGRQLSNLRIFHNFIDVNGEKKFTKWVRYLDATPDQIEKATHRTLLMNEIVLDYDPEKYETFEQLTKKVKKVCYELKKNKVEYECYFTGSRGYHIHIFIREFLKLKPHQLYEAKVKFIKYYGAELQKNSQNVPIAIEYVNHWKTGKPKTRCDW